MQQHVYLEKIRVLRAGSWDVKVSLCLNNVAWNNRIRPRFYSVGLIEQQTSWFRHQTACCWCGLCSVFVVWGLKISVPWLNLTIKAPSAWLAFKSTEAMVKRNSRGGISTAS